MAKTIKETTEPLDGPVVIKVKCSFGSPYGAENEEIDFLATEVQEAKAKGFIK